MIEIKMNVSSDDYAVAAEGARFLATRLQKLADGKELEELDLILFVLKRGSAEGPAIGTWSGRKIESIPIKPRPSGPVRSW